MFDNDKKKNQIVKANETTTTVIGQGIFIEGQTFKGTGTVRIDGVYMGEMFVDGHIVVSQTGEIRGNITTNTMILAGTVTGNITCREELHITDTAVTEGEIHTNSIIVDQGAGISGTINTRRKTLVEPISLDDAVKNLNSGKKSIEMLDDLSTASLSPTSRKHLSSIDDKICFFSK